MKTHFKYLFCTLLLLSPFYSLAQKTQPDTTARVVIRTTDGNEFVGTILRQDSAVVVLQTDIFPEITIRRESIQRMTKVPPGNKYLFETPASTCYFIFQSANGLRKGEGYYHNGWIFLNQFAYGVTDHFSISGGGAPFFIFDEGNVPVWIHPKLSFPLVENKLHVSLGAIMGKLFSSYEEDETIFGATIGQVTFGSRDIHATVGVGIPWNSGSWGEAPLFAFSGMLRLTPRFAFLTENFFISDSGDFSGFNILGGRIIGRRTSFDFGLIAAFDDFDYGGIPWIGLHVLLGRKR